MDTLRVRSFSLLALLALEAQILHLAKPHWAWWITALALTGLATAALMARWSTTSSTGRWLRVALVVLLMVGVGQAWHLVRVAGYPDDVWAARARDHLQVGAEDATAAMLQLRLDAQQIAQTALDPNARLESLATSIRVAGSELPLGVSVWDSTGIQDWVGHVPGPDRPAANDFPLIVDHGFRRYLTVSVRDGAGRVAFADVGLGITGDLFPRLGVGEDPGEPISSLTGLAVEVLAQPPEPEAIQRSLDRVVPVPADEPWVWLVIRAPGPRDERRLAVAEQGSRLARWLLLALTIASLMGLRYWPHGGGRLRTLRKMFGWIVGLAVLRWSLHASDLFALALADFDALSLMFEPAYFATTRAWGLLRNVTEFLVTAVGLAAVSLLLLPAALDALRRAARSRLRGLIYVLWIAATVGVLVLCTSLQGIVAQNANPKLIGLDAPFFTIAFQFLQLAMLLTLMSPVGWVLLGWERLAPPGLRAAFAGTLLAAVVVVGALALLGQGWGLALWGGSLPVLGWVLRPAVRESSFARRVIAVLLAGIWLAGVQSHGLENVYTQLREGLATQRAEERMTPRSWPSFLLEDLLQELSQDPGAIDMLTDATADRENAAFELWAASSLSASLGYWGSRVELLGSDGRLISEFDLGLPYEPRPVRSWRLRRPEPGEFYTVEAIELPTNEGPFLVYRGTLFLDQLVAGDNSILVVDLPYASQDPAASTEINLAAAGPAALGFAPGRELDPRQDFASPILLARVRDNSIVSASDPRLLDLPLSRLSREDRWTSLRLVGERYRCRRVDAPEAGDDIVVAFALPAFSDRLLDASRLVAVFVLWSLAILALVVAIRAGRRQARGAWPRALGEFGFQERLLGSILLVVILPLIISGVFHQRRAGDRLRSANIEEVAHRLDTAVHLLSATLDDLATALVSGEYVQDVLLEGNTTARRDLGPFESGQLMVFSPTDELLLDESLRNLDAAAARSFLRSVEPGQLVLESDGGAWFLGRLYPVSGPQGQTYRVFVRKLLTDVELGRLARTVGCDLTLYDGAWAVVSSQDYLYRAGLLSPVLPIEAERIVLSGVSRRSVQADPREGLVVATGYVSVAGVDEERRGVLAARLFRRATEAAKEQRRAQLFLFGLSSLAFVLAVAVGLLLSSRIVDPIRNLVAATRRVGAGDLDVQIPAAGEDEVGELVHSFNRMTGQLQQGQRELASRRGFLEAVLGNLSAGVLVIDQAARVQETNASARRLLDGHESNLLRQVQELGPPPALVASEMTLPSGDGPRTLRVVVDPIELESGDPGWLVLFDDVTELLASRRLALYAEMARQVAHEVKNPLTPIQLAAQMVRQACDDDHPRLPEIVAESTGQIETQVKRLRGIASEFSLLDKTDSPTMSPVRIAPLLQEIQAAYPSVDGSLRVEVEPSANDPVALAAPSTLTKVLTNLVENAIQAMGGEGRVLLGTEVNGSEVSIWVQDEGPGIPPEVEDRLFEPYFSTKSTGTGLGLVICRNLMEKMGGAIRLENRQDGPGAQAILQLGLAPSDFGNDS